MQNLKKSIISKRLPLLLVGLSFFLGTAFIIQDAKDATSTVHYLGNQTDDFVAADRAPYDKAAIMQSSHFSTTPWPKENTSGCQAELIGHWKFDNKKDVIGKFGDLTLVGATLKNGNLIIKGTKKNQGARADSYAYANNYSGTDFTEKTLVSWVKLKDFTEIGGSILTVEKVTTTQVAPTTISDFRFDAIVFGEQYNAVPKKNPWIAGSNDWHRTEFKHAYEEPVSAINTTVKVAITYERVREKSTLVKIYHDDKLVDAYVKGDIHTFKNNETQIVFGARHFARPGNPVGGLDAEILEARLYKGAMCKEELKLLPTP